MDNFQPGQVISPNSNTPQSPTPDDGAPVPVRQPETTGPIPTPTPSPEPVMAPSIAAPSASAEPTALYNPEAVPQSTYTAPQSDVVPQAIASTAVNESQRPDEAIQWVASEFHDHDKGMGWFVVLALVGVVAAAVIYLLTKDRLTTGIIVLTAIAFGISAARKPRQQQYSLSYQGLQVGIKTYSLHDFKSFSAVEEATAASIVLMPLKRFMPALTIYVPRDIEDNVVDFLAQILPVEEHKADALDSLLRRIHF